MENSLEKALAEAFENITIWSQVSYISSASTYRGQNPIRGQEYVAMGSGGHYRAQKDFEITIFMIGAYWIGSGGGGQTTPYLMVDDTKYDFKAGGNDIKPIKISVQKDQIFEYFSGYSGTGVNLMIWALYAIN